MLSSLRNPVATMHRIITFSFRFFFSVVSTNNFLNLSFGSHIMVCIYHSWKRLPLSHLPLAVAVRKLESLSRLCVLHPQHVSSHLQYAEAMQGK